MKKSCNPVILSFLFLFFATLGRSEPAQPDLVLLLIDSVRADHISANGYPKPTTPVLDAFAKTGARFTQAVSSAPWTQPSVMSLFTSVPADIHLRTNGDKPHAEGITTLAETLRAAGYQTIGITANTMTHRQFGFMKGFEHYDDYTVALSEDIPAVISLQAATTPVLSGGTVPERPIVWDNRINNGLHRGVRTSHYKVTARDPFDTPLEVYDLQTDPQEKTNLVKDGTTLSEEVKALLPLLKPVQ